MTKCNGIDCPIKIECKRYRNRKDGQDWYFTGSPYNEITKSCEHFKKGYFSKKEMISLGIKEEMEYAKMFERVKK